MRLEFMGKVGRFRRMSIAIRGGSSISVPRSAARLSEIRLSQASRTIVQAREIVFSRKLRLCRRRRRPLLLKFNIARSMGTVGGLRESLILI